MERHTRFFMALCLGGLAFAAMQFSQASMEFKVLVAVDAFYLSFLGLMLRLVVRATPNDLRLHSQKEDEGLPLILVLSVVVLSISLIAIVVALNGPSGGGVGKRALALISVPLGWLTMQSLIAFHYAKIYYHARPETEAAPMIFPGSDLPGHWDFFYFTFVLAMCAQVSDVTTNSSAMRRVVLFHSVGSFFYNAVILALVVAAITADL